MINSLIWLPLNGTLDYIEPEGGLLTQVEGNTNPNYNINGKIGKCLLNEGAFKFSDEAVGLIDHYLEKGEYSISIWVKFTENRENYINNNRWCFYFGNAGIVGGAIGFWVTGSEDYIAVGHSYGETDVSVNKSIFDKQWHNICFIVKDRVVKVYIDGDYHGQNTIANNNNPSGGQVYFNTSGIALNDLRLYSRCLSVKEIKYLSKCLIAQYRLDNSGYGNDNLQKGTDNLKDNMYWDLGIGVRADKEEGSHGSKSVKFTNNNIGSFQWSAIKFNNSVNVANILKPSTKYVLSFLLKTNSNRINFTVRCDDASKPLTNGIPLQPKGNGEWERFEIVFTTLSEFPELTTQVVYFLNLESSIGTYYEFSSIKLEEGEIATPWCPNKIDDSYNDYFNNNEKDLSGYGHNGVITNVEYTSDSKRSFGSTIMSTSTDSRIRMDGIIPFGFECSELTFSTWFKLSYSNNIPRNLITIGVYPFFFRVCVDGSLNSIHIFYRNSTVTDSNAYIDHGFNCTVTENTWHFICVTFKQGVFHLYYDGLHLGTYSHDQVNTLTFSTLNGEKNDTYIGSLNTPPAQGFNGQMSDVRVYLSAFSDKDVLDLYKTAVAVDNEGNIWLYGHQPPYTNQISVSEKGIAYADNWHFVDNSVFSVGKGYIKCRNIIYM